MKIITSRSFENMFKMADVRFTPEELAKMRAEGLYVVNDPDIAEPNTMQSVPKTERMKNKIKSIVPQMTLPKIMYPSVKHIVEMEGRQYYIIQISKPNPKKNFEGTISLLDIETGEPIKRPFMAVADKLKEIKKGQVAKSIEELNAVVQKWNTSIDKIQRQTQIINPSTWPLQILWAEGIVNSRLEELAAQEKSLLEQLDKASNFSPSFSSSLDRIKNDIMAGRIPSEDIYDSLIFIQHSDPDMLETILSSDSVSEEVKTKTRSLVGIRDEEIQKEKAKRDAAAAAKTERMDAPASEQEIEGMLNTGEMKWLSLDDETNESYNPRMAPDSYYAPKGRISQIRKSLSSIRDNKNGISKVKTAFDSLADFVGRLKKGERARAILTDPVRGTEIKSQIANFLYEAKSFIRGYKEPVFVKNQDSNQYNLNPKMLGTEGGLGNGAVLLALTHISNVIAGGLAAYASSAPPPDDGDLAEIPQNVEDYMMQPQDVPV